MDDYLECEDLYDMIAELRGMEEKSLVFPRFIKGVDYGDSEPEESFWFHPIEMTWEHFSSLTDREVVRYIYSQELTIN